MEAGHGLLVAFEGGEGAGKSTQVRLLADWLAELGRPPLLSREPGGTPAGERIRTLLLDPDTSLTPLTEAMLYAADRAEHTQTVLRPALADGRIVLCDRYVDSSLAYQGAGRALDQATVRLLSEWATGGLRPGLTVLLDLDPALGLARAATTGDRPDRIEQESLTFHERVRAGFLELARAEPQRYLVLDATEEPARSAHRVRERLLEEIAVGGARA